MISEKDRLEKIKEQLNLSDHTFHVEGFTSTSFDRAIAEKFAIEGVWGERTPVVIEMLVEIHEGKYRGFQLNKPEYTAYPEENEFLLLDGADVIIEGLDYLESEKYNGTKYLSIKMKQINDWKED